ncbi:PIG-L family deacetylase, partial [Myxococcota bacterium]|nr:PIG-L family deacetylase [Myxococcota bacterium]
DALRRVIAASAGLFLRATAARPGAVPGATIPVKLEVIVRRPAKVSVRAIDYPGVDGKLPEEQLPPNEKKEWVRDVPIPADAPISAPYWLAAPMLAARQVVADPSLVGAPVGPAALVAKVALTIEGLALVIDVPVQFAWTDRVHGERVRDFLVVPPATVTPARKAVMFPNGKPAPVVLRVRAGRDALAATVGLELPAGWRARPDVQKVELAKAGDEAVVRFDVTPPKTGAVRSEVHPFVDVDGKNWSWREDVIDYAHLPYQQVLQPARLVLSPLAIALPKGVVGYVDGSGDTIADDLAHVGLRVERIDDETLTSGDLGRYSAILVGIRAYNTKASLKAGHARLVDYAAKGGTVVVQYVTSSRVGPLELAIGPHPLEVGRDRITDESAVVSAVKARHPLLTKPNVISDADWQGWVQERGLYFGSKWDPKWEVVLRMADPNEKPLEGGLLVARHGRGRWIYTGLSFFRQLPAGVPGGYRLLVNLLAR